ncbi:hypothetical protein ACKGJO_05940 [Gracilimonas sp. Q87]|uniref:hypothetical protein n=1 Tax=Gracilimonas sp. Q87 TaxID=3384766 RepID=UPI0039843832
MKSVEKLITQINDSSSNILIELDSNEPSFDTIIKELKQREKFVKMLGQYKDKYTASSLQKGEMTSIKSHFNVFNELNQSIQDKAKDMLEFQEKKLANAKRKRKAEDQYNVSQNPNISYY